MALIDEIGGARAIYTWGLAKNAGKTVTLRQLLTELEGTGHRIGVTSVGRDGEAHDVLDERIAKPRLRLSAGTVVATAEQILSRYGADVDVLQRTRFSSPLGTIVLARMRRSELLEIAGPSSVDGTVEIVEAMRRCGAEFVLIDGALDRRAGAAPRVSDGIVLSTGAVLDQRLARVVEYTRDAVDRVRLRPVRDAALAAACRGAQGPFARDAHGDDVTLGSNPLIPDERELLALRRAGFRPSAIFLVGALVEVFVEAVVKIFPATSITFVVRDFTRLFVSLEAWRRFLARDLIFEVLQPAKLLAITVNPSAPFSHDFDSGTFRAAIAEAIDDVPVFDVMSTSYAWRGRPRSLSSSIRRCRS
jgi:hypothetical protein